MAQFKRYEDLVLGSGRAASTLVRHIARSSLRIALVEREWICGFCPSVN